MPIPDYQTIMLPLLRFAGDKKEHAMAAARDQLGTEFSLTPEELSQMLPSGTQTTFYNRTQWAKFYLAKAGLLESPRRSIFKITHRGLEVLKNAPPMINNAFLEQFEAFRRFRGRHGPDKVTASTANAGASPGTPEEMLDSAYVELRRTLASEVLERVLSATPQFFEQLVVDLLLAMGYGGTSKDAGQAIGKSGDEGIDGVIREDRLGLDVIYIQAKRWEGTVGRPDIQKFIGALHTRGAQKGVFLTTGTFSAEATREAEKASSAATKVVLIDGERLAQLMIDFDVGVTTTTVYKKKRIDSDYFTEE